MIKGEIFDVKRPNSKRINFSTGTHPFRPCPKFKILLPIFSSLGLRFPKRYATSLLDETQGGDTFSRNRLFGPRAVPCRAADLRPQPKIIRTELDWSWKFHQDPFISTKIILLFLNDIHTDAHPPIHLQTGKFFIPIWYLSLHSLCLWNLM